MNAGLRWRVEGVGFRGNVGVSEFCFVVATLTSEKTKFQLPGSLNTCNHL